MFEKNREEQLEKEREERKKLQKQIIAHADERLKEWAHGEKINIVRVHYQPNPYRWSLEVVIFYEYGREVREYGENGKSEEARKVFIEGLEEERYSRQFRGGVQFAFDSHENVLQHYGGSYDERLKGPLVP